MRSHLGKVGCTFLFVLAASHIARANDCSNLTSLAIPDTVITSAENVAPPFTSTSFYEPDEYARFVKIMGELKAKSISTATVLVPFCRVIGEMHPTGDSHIQFEVWLPINGWNGRFAGVGNGGLSGHIMYPSMGRRIARGFAVAGTDRGHVGGQAAVRWADGHEERVVDWAYRATHLMAGTGKAITQTYYHRAPKYSYFSGCSAGGQQGMTEARMYPKDYDGILAGGNAPVSPNRLGRMAVAPILATSGGLDAAKLRMISDAAVKKCDGLDGVKDGLVEDPRRCNFDPSSLQCKEEASGSSCLTAQEVSAVKRMYSEARQVPTGEYYWRFFEKIGMTSPGLTELMKSLARLSPKTPEDLSGLRDSGTKFIMYNGWFDPTGPALAEYYDEIRHTLGPDATRKGVRLFMVPGMEHCIGGPGPNNFSTEIQPARPALGPDQDIFAALIQWVEQGKAPDQIIATKYEDDDPAKRVLRTRPICAYPTLAHYKGSGSIDDAASFTCGASKAGPDAEVQSHQ